MGTRTSTQDDDMYLTAEELWELLEKTMPTNFVTGYFPSVRIYTQNGYVGTYEGKSVYIVEETVSLTDLQEVL